MICNLKDDRMCHSMTHTCDHYIPLLVDMALILQIDGKQFTIPPEGYTRSNVNGHKCEVLISYGVGEFRLGLPFLKSYVSSFSYGEDMAITFGVSTAAVNGTKITDAGLFEIMYLTLPAYTITIPILSVLIVAFYCVFKCVCQKA